MPRRLFQFRLRTLLGLAVAVAIVFGAARGLGLSGRATGLMLAVVVASVVAVIGLMAALAASLRDGR